MKSLVIQLVLFSLASAIDAAPLEWKAAAAKAIITPQELLSPVNTIRQNLQVEYVSRLINISRNNYFLPAAQGVAIYELRKIEDFLRDCVQTTGDTTKNAAELNKLLGGITHNVERFSFDVSGVDLNFSNKNLAPFAVTSDAERPDDADVATELSADQQTLGRFANDRVGNDPAGKRDNHGAGLVYLEYARIVQDTLNGYAAAAGRPTHALGDPKCVARNGEDPRTFVPEDGCTGFEGFVTCAPSPFADVATSDVNALGWPGCAAVNGNLATGLKPGHPSSAFCVDADGQNLGRLAATIAEVLRGRYKQIPDMRWEEMRHWICDQTKAISEWVVRGTPIGGKPIEFLGCDLWEFRDGWVTKKDTYWKFIA